VSLLQIPVTDPLFIAVSKAINGEPITDKHEMAALLSLQLLMMMQRGSEGWEPLDREAARLGWNS
jgi:hypothetical protein